jgi:hypothetical protein
MKKLVFFAIFAALIGCHPCFTQPPDQTVYVDTACNVIVPDYTTMFFVEDNCTNVEVFQYPPAGTIIPEAVNFSVDIIARDAYSNSSGVMLNVIVLDTIAPVLIYIGDTIQATLYHMNEIDLTFHAMDAHRESLGAEPQDNILIRRIRDE